MLNYYTYELDTEMIARIGGGLYTKLKPHSNKPLKKTKTLSIEVIYNSELMFEKYSLHEFIDEVIFSLMHDLRIKSDILESIKIGKVINENQSEDVLINVIVGD